MRKIILYIAASLDGYIAKTDGSVEWLHKAAYRLPNEDYGYKVFYESIDTTLMGYNTYGEILGFSGPFPYPDKTNYVFTRSNRPVTDHVVFIKKDIIEFVRDLKNRPGKNIWLVGGGEINAMLLGESLVDTIILTVIPVALGKGIPLFPGLQTCTRFTLLKAESYLSGLCQLSYMLKS